MPDGASPRPVTPATGVLRLDFYQCEKVAIEGIDVGPAALAYLSTRLLNQPAGAEDDGNEPWWIFEFTTNSPSVESFLGRIGLISEKGSVTSAFEELPRTLGRLTGTVGEGQTPAYQFDGTAYSETKSMPHEMRYCFEASAERCFTSRGAIVESVGDGPGTVIFQPAAKGAEILQVPSYQAFFASRVMEAVEIRLPV